MFYYNAVEKAKKWGGVLKEGKLVVYAKCKSTFMDQSGNLKDSWQKLQDYVGFDLDLRFPDCPVGSKGEPRDGVTVLGRPVSYRISTVRRVRHQEEIREENSE